MTQSEPRRYPFSSPDRLDFSPPHGEDAWLATHREDDKAVLTDPMINRPFIVSPDDPRIRPHTKNNRMLTMGPPEHARLTSRHARPRVSTEGRETT